MQGGRRARTVESRDLDALLRRPLGLTAELSLRTSSAVLPLLAPLAV